MAKTAFLDHATAQGKKSGFVVFVRTWVLQRLQLLLLTWRQQCKLKCAVAADRAKSSLCLMGTTLFSAVLRGHYPSLGNTDPEAAA